jgi:hypothetical protein
MPEWPGMIRKPSVDLAIVVGVLLAFTDPDPGRQTDQRRFAASFRTQR